MEERTVDWRDDEVLSARISAMNRPRRHQAAFLALRRLQAPLLGIEMPADWGIDSVVVDALLRSGGVRLDGEADEVFQQAVAELCAAPLFESEVDPEFAELFQLETIGGWILLGEALGEMSEVQTDGIISLARELANSLDTCMDDSLTVVEGEDLRERYLAGIDERLHAYGVGYFASRNLEVEGKCHEAILAASDDGELFTSAAGRELLVDCDDYSNEMLSALRSFTKDVWRSSVPPAAP
ncbi:hypothetical protein ACFXI6_10365 [Streptomyces mirabilis]|uniref:hypothetical protein n=2 Tax=Streptomyces mirabilis TaxID=68239 RepID=UPI0036B960FE